MKKAILASLVLGSVALSQTAMAADIYSGTITINGNVLASTCQVDTAGADGNQTVTLPDVAAGLLTTAGSTAGKTAFTIKLKNCTENKNVRATFKGSGTQVEANTGLLNNTAASGASNVMVQLLDLDGVTPIKANYMNNDNSQTVTVATGATTASLTYAAQYYAKGVAGTGAVTSTVDYEIVYE